MLSDALRTCLFILSAGSGLRVVVTGRPGVIALAAWALAAASPADARSPQIPVQPTGSVAGQVVDGATGAPIAGAEVSLEDGDASTLTDPDGLFMLRSLSAGSHVLLVWAPGYLPGRQVARVVAGEITAVRFSLSSDSTSVDHHRVQFMVPQSRVMAREMEFSGLGRVMIDPGLNTESYALVEENAFRLVGVSPLSTFAIDVDRASYANVRRFIQSGVRPPVDAVRIEEMVNYFPYEWRHVDGDHPFSVTTEVWDAPWARGHRLVRIGLHAPTVDTEDLPASNLVLLLDVSGSMRAPNKLPLLKRALALLVTQLRSRDRVAIVVYAGAAGLVLPSTQGDRHGEITAALENLTAGGSTAGGAGLELAYEVAGEHYLPGGNNRVILATDGDFNVGPSSDAEMVRLIEDRRDAGVFLTVLGLGIGNLKDSKMEQLANHGNGAYHYVDGLLEAKKVLVEEMGGTLLTLAQDVKVQVEFNPKRAAGYRLIGYENRLLNDEDFNDDTKDAGELGAGHTVTALYEVVPSGQPVPQADAGELRYQAAPALDSAEGDFADELLFVRVRYKDPAGRDGPAPGSHLLTRAVVDRPTHPSRDFRFAAAVAGFGMLLRDSPHAGDFTLQELIRLARDSMGLDQRGYRGEFIRLVETVRDLGWLQGR